jgi:hypothetical protein
VSATAALAVVCPKWCRVTQEEHLEELRLGWEGIVNHESAPGFRATLSHVLRADGSQYGDPSGPDVLIAYTELMGTGAPAEIVAQAEQVIRDIRAAVATLQA